MSSPWKWMLFKIGLFCAFSLWAALACALTPLIITAGQNHYYLSENPLSRLWTSNAPEGTSPVLLGSRDEGWNPVESRQEYRSLDCRHCWLRLDLENASPAEDLFYLVFEIAHVRRVRADVLVDGRVVSTQKAGIDIPFSEWSQRFVRPTFAMTIPRGKRATLILEIRSSTGFSLPLSLYSAAGYSAMRDWSGFVLGASVIAALALAFSSGGLFLVIRERLFFTLSLLPLTGIMSYFSLVGYDYALFWPSAHHFELFSKYLFGYLNLLVMSMLGFEVLKDAKWWQKVLLACPLLGITVTVPAMFWPESGALSVLVAIIGTSSFLVFGFSLMTLSLRNRMARRLLLAFLVYVSGYVLFMLTILSVIPRWNPYEILIPLGMITGGALVLFGLHDRLLKTRLLETQTLLLEDFNRSLVRELEERKRIENDLRSARELADAASRARNEFLANVSHEIRTPLNGILGVAELLHVGNLPPPFDEYVRLMQGSGETLLGLVNNLLDFSRIENRAPTIELSSFDLQEMLVGVCAPYAVLAEGRNIAFLREYDPQVPLWVEGDEWKIRRVLMSLLDNALKYTSQGLVKIRTRLVEKRLQAIRVAFEIEDSGSGIEPHWLPKLFQPFSRVDSALTRKVGGTGLGLVIAKRLVETMGGSISVDSVYGRGTTFRVEIPLHSLDAE